MFLAVIFLQLGGIYLFMPAITCGVLTAEKERNTIGLLLLTKLGPWTILLEKLLGRLVPMGTFLLLSFPLLGFSYALGGVTQRELWTGVLTLFLSVVQVGTLALACSAYFRTTVQAFIATYVIGFLMYFGPITLVEMIPPLREVSRVLAEMYNGVANSIAALAWLALRGPEALSQGPAGPLEPLDLQEHDFPALFFTPVMLLERWNLALWQVMPRSLPTVVSIAAFLVLARLFVVRRAFVPARNYLLKLFHRLDGLFHRINDNRVTKGIVLINESATLPDDEPVAWRETKKKSLGTVRYLIRILVATEAPVLIICLLLAMSGTGFQSHYGGSEPISALIFVAWVLVTLLISVKAATLIAGERSHETLDVLLSTPLRSAELVRQKFRGVRRLMAVLAVPLLTMIAFQTYWREATTSLSTDWSHARHPLLYFVASTLAVVIYLPLIAWLSFWIGLKVRSQARAIFGSLALLAGWSVIPFILFVIVIEILRFHRHTPLHYFALLSPAAIIPFSEFSALDEMNDTPWLAVVMNFLFYGAILFFVRRSSLRYAARHLGRAESPEYPAPVGAARRVA
jgi:ABC-type transport system involved in multi-copper enzyme maturation permease subunit